MSPKKADELRILIPLLSKQEDNEFFLEQIPEEAKEIFLLLIIDRDLMVGQFGFAASEIGTGNELMQKAKEFFEKKNKKCTEIEEWGNTEHKILQIAQLKEIGKIFFVKQDNYFYKKLVKGLMEQTKNSIEEIKIPVQEKPAQPKEKFWDLSNFVFTKKEETEEKTNKKKEKK